MFRACFTEPDTGLRASGLRLSVPAHDAPVWVGTDMVPFRLDVPLLAPIAQFESVDWAEAWVAARSKLGTTVIALDC